MGTLESIFLFFVLYTVAGLGVARLAIWFEKNLIDTANFYPPTASDSFLGLIVLIWPIYLIIAAFVGAAALLMWSCKTLGSLVRRLKS